METKRHTAIRATIRTELAFHDFMNDVFYKHGIVLSPREALRLELAFNAGAVYGMKEINDIIVGRDAQ